MHFSQDTLPALLDDFSQNGYAILPHIVPTPLLNRLRQFFEEEMQQPLQGEGKAINEVRGVQYICNIENLCQRQNLACLELLAQPFVQTVAAAICGPDFFPIQDFAVVKCLGDNLPVLWHQDMTHQRMGRCCTMGIYLDDADENDGALRIVPGSHSSNETICQMIQRPFVEVPMKAGDILIHDMMLAHSSEPLQRNPLRRVIYFEFLSAAHVAAEAIYNEAIVQRRTRLLQVAADYQYLLEKGATDLSEIRLALGEIYCDWVKARPSTYCLDVHYHMDGQ